MTIGQLERLVDLPYLLGMDDGDDEQDCRAVGQHQDEVDWYGPADPFVVSGRRGKLAILREDAPTPWQWAI